MYRYTLFILLLLFWRFSLEGQFVEFPDPNFFSAAIENGADSNNDGKISFNEAASVRSLFMRNCGLQDLTGIEAFINLDTLSFNGHVYVGDDGYHPNEVTFLDLSSLVQLKYLDCSDNKINTLTLGEQNELTTVSAGFNQLTELDVTSCPELTILFVLGNPISYLNLEQNHQLKELCIDEIYNHLTVCFSPEDLPLDQIHVSSAGTTDLYMGVCDIPLIEILKDSLVHPENVEFTCTLDATVYLVLSNMYQTFEEIRGQCLDSLEVVAMQVNEFDLTGINDSILWLVAIDPSGNLSEYEIFYIFESPGEETPDDEPAEDDSSDDESSEEHSPDEIDDPTDEAELEVILYPNPTDKLVTIEAEEDIAFTFDILNDKGQILTHRNMVESPCLLDLSELKYGIYMFRIIIGNQLYVKKVVRY